MGSSDAAFAKSKHARPRGTKSLTYIGRIHWPADRSPWPHVDVDGPLYVMHDGVDQVELGD